jgi:hypothetical protein
MNETSPTGVDGTGATTPHPASTAPSGWDAAPTATIDEPAPASAPAGGGYPAPAGDPYGPGVWRGGATPGWSGAPERRRKPRAPWFWPVVAIVVGLAALLVGGGIGFAIGHAIGSGSSSSTSQFPGRDGNGFPGGGTGQFPGQGGTGTNGGTGTGTGTGTSGTGTSGTGTSGTGTNS